MRQGKASRPRQGKARHKEQKTITNTKTEQKHQTKKTLQEQYHDREYGKVKHPDEDDKDT